MFICCAECFWQLICNFPDLFSSLFASAKYNECDDDDDGGGYDDDANDDDDDDDDDDGDDDDDDVRWHDDNVGYNDNDDGGADGVGGVSIKMMM